MLIDVGKCLSSYLNPFVKAVVAEMSSFSSPFTFLPISLVSLQIVDTNVIAVILTTLKPFAVQEVKNDVFRNLVSQYSWPICLSAPEMHS